MHVRTMTPGDAPGLVVLFHEMQAHYRVPCPPDDTILQDLQNLPAGVAVLVAADPGVVGVATLGTICPGPGLRPGLFLKDLFVSAERRGGGVGAALLRGAAQLAVERGLARIDWTVDREDARLLAFYRRTSAAEQSEKLFFRLAGDALKALASNETTIPSS